MKPRERYELRAGRSVLVIFGVQKTMIVPQPLHEMGRVKRWLVECGFQHRPDVSYTEAPDQAAQRVTRLRPHPAGGWRKLWHRASLVVFVNIDTGGGIVIKDREGQVPRSIDLREVPQ